MKVYNVRNMNTSSCSNI